MPADMMTSAPSPPPKEARQVRVFITSTSRAAAGQGVAPVYFVEVPGLDTPGFEQAAAAWVARVRRRNHFDLRPWHDEGVEALKREDVRARLKALEETLHASIAKMHRIANAPGNLASHNPHFVGRSSSTCSLWIVDSGL